MASSSALLMAAWSGRLSEIASGASSGRPANNAASPSDADANGSDNPPTMSCAVAMNPVRITTDQGYGHGMSDQRNQHYISLLATTLHVASHGVWIAARTLWKSTQSLMSIKFFAKIFGRFLGGPGQLLIRSLKTRDILNASRLREKVGDSKYFRFRCEIVGQDQERPDGQGVRSATTSPLKTTSRSLPLCCLQTGSREVMGTARRKNGAARHRWGRCANSLVQIQPPQPSISDSPVFRFQA
jgi:hypothetical protein